MGVYATTTDSLRLKGVHFVNVVVTGNIIDGHSNSITATLKDVDNDTVVSFDAKDFTVTAQDENELTVQIATAGNEYTDSIDVTATNGVATETIFFALPVGVGSTISVRYQIKTAHAINDYQCFGVDEVDVGALTLAFTAEPGNVSRDTNFSFTIQAQDGAGNKVESATDVVTLTLTDADANDVFTSPTPDAVIILATLVDGEWSTATEQITGGAGTDAGATIVATAVGYTGTTSAAFTIGEVITVVSYGFMEDSAVDGTWAQARANCDNGLDQGPHSNYGGRISWHGVGVKYYRIYRAGRKVTDIIGKTSLTVTWKKYVYDIASSFDFYIRYSNVALTPGIDYRTSGDLLATITVSPGEHNDEGSFDGSAAINGTDDIYIWSVAKVDVNDDFPAWTAGSKDVGLNILGITMS